jgi:putative ABC transport system permease protein
VTNTHGGISIQAGRDFEGHSPRYANGTYEGEMTRSVIVDPRTAELFDLEPGDEISVGVSRSE